MLAGLLLWAVAAEANPTWGSLWRTDEQRGQQLLRQGKPAEAARLFRDPRRKAYAELQAGNFPRAAEDFAAFGDSDSQYNRGNALARAGRLQEAIKAYDTALARDPNNRDARHNRELVAQALQKQPPKPQSASSKGQQNPTGQSGQADQKKGGGSAGTPNNDSASKSPSSSATQAGKPGQNNDSGAQTPPTGSGQPQQGQPQPGQPQSAQAATARPAPDRGNASANASQQPANDAAQARSEAAAALAQPQTGQQAAPSGAPLSERQLAEEQWLRRIPDDPGGLLRRKFLIEHLIRQQGTQP